MPLGPRVLLTRSPTAMAPTNAARRAFSPFSSVVPSSKIWVGLKEDWGYVLVSEQAEINIIVQLTILSNMREKKERV